MLCKMENFCNRSSIKRFQLLKILVLGVLCLAPKCAALVLSGTSTSYARYPTWNGCPNASFSFEFSTTSRPTSATLLWYVDGGIHDSHKDFLVLTIESSRVRLVLRTAGEADGAVEIINSNEVADGRWHRVEVRRRRMDTLLDVDGTVSLRSISGADFEFGIGTNSDVYIGGLPSDCRENLPTYSLPSACFNQRFSGKIRNVAYRNCTCQLERVSMLNGDGTTQDSEDWCERNNTCRGCLCISGDARSTKCDCSSQQCTAVTHYELPMDEIREQRLVNPSGLDAMAYGSPALHEGIRSRAVALDGKDKYVKVSGQAHRSECFGDLDLCTSGYTLSVWIQFAKPGDPTAYTFLSNGGHSVQNHGVAMMYGRRSFEVRFKKKNGVQWTAISSDVLPQRWCHVAASWHPGRGLFLYVNGELVHAVNSSTSGTPVNPTNFNDFIIGRPNDATGLREVHQMLVDDFKFWSVFKSEREIRETGPFFRFYSSMDAKEDIVHSNLRGQVRGSPGLVSGKMGNAVAFRTGGDYIDGGNLNGTCLGNLTLCHYGITISMWIFFTSLQQDTYILSTGNQAIGVYFKDGVLKGEFWEGGNYWNTSWMGAETNRWYFLEFSWLMGDWLRLYVDLGQITNNGFVEDSVPPPSSGSNFYVARGNGNLQNMGAFIVDDLELWYGEREKLISTDFIARGRPVQHNITMDSIENSTLVHPSLRISLFGNPRITPGRISGAVYLDGQDKYMSLGPQETSCLGNLDLCRHGFLLSTWLRLGRLREGMDILSSGNNGLQVRYIGGQVSIRARTSIHEWTVRTDAIAPDAWSFLEIGWDPHRGLSLYVDKDLISQNSSSTLRSDTVRASQTVQQFYIGRGDGTESGASYGNLTIDDFEYWFGNREYLIAFGYLLRGRPQRYFMNMDLIRGRNIPNQDLNITVLGSPAVVSGKINNAISLNGNDQSIDFGSHGEVCLGYLEDCSNGLTASIFLKFRSFRENTSYLSSGGGVRIFFSGLKLVVLLHVRNDQWKVEIPNLTTDKWYFFEYTWHRSKGLRVFVNNQLVGRQDSPTPVDSGPKTGNFTIGAGNAGDGPFAYADVLVDEVEVWYADRDLLVAFDYLLRDRMTYIVFPMDRVAHPDYTITMQGRAAVGPGKVGNGVMLGGSGDYVSFGDQRRSCMGNLKLCKHGMTIAFLLNPRQFTSDSYILSSGSYSVFFRDNKLFVKFSLPMKTFELSTNRIGANIWNKLEISWDESRGFLLYVNGSLVNSTFSYSNHSTLVISDYVVYLGKPNQAANAVVDELEFWFANRDLLKAFDVISDEITRLIINMDSVTGGIIDQSTSVSFHGSPVTTNGIIGSGVILNGQEQFINISGDVGCRGDLHNCLRGFTLRFKIKPNQLSENTYFVSSGILDVFYQNDRLVVEVRTTSKSWVTSTPEFELGVWQQVEVSWHSVEGLKLYINTREVDQEAVGRRFDRPYNDERVFYVGRFHSEMQQKLYASAVFDDYQLFEGRREYLIPDLINPGRDLELIRAAYPSTPSVTAPPTIRFLTVTYGPQPTSRKWVMFDGSAFVRYSFSSLSDYLRWRDIATQSLQLTFQTTNIDGLLWYTGNSSYFFALGLEEGKIKLVLKGTVSSETETRTYEEVFNPGQNLHLNDGAWHRIVFTQSRRDGLVKLVIDGHEFPKNFTSYINLVNPNFFYFGGIRNIGKQTSAHFWEGFNGTISESMMSDGTSENSLDLIAVTVTDPLPAYVHREGNIVYVDPPPLPLTFTSERSYVRLPIDVSGEITVELSFRTFEPNSLILSIDGGATGSLCLELFDGLLYLVLGSNRYAFRRPAKPLNDGELHVVKFSLGQRSFLLDLDGVTSTFSSGSANQISGFEPFISIGGVRDRSRLPQNIWSYDQPFFRGCLSEIQINGGRVVDLEQYVKGQAGFEVGCPDFSSHCAKSPCVNGVCSERSVGRYCDCSTTRFTGQDCNIDAQFLGFSGEDYLRFLISQATATHTNDVSLRFKGLKENSFLFSLSNRQTGQFLRAVLIDGAIKIETNIGSNKTLQLICRHPLNDNQWHTVRLKRRPDSLQAFVDGCIDPDPSVSSGDSSYSFAVDEILIGKSGRHDDAFVGYLQNFYVDGYRFFEVMEEGSGSQFPRVSFNSTVRLTTEEVELSVFPVTFTRQTYVNVMRSGENRTLHFVFRTSVPDGLMIYNPGSAEDFFAVELVAGILQVSANDASGVQVVKATGTQLSDGRWHMVSILEATPKRFEIVVNKDRIFVLTFPSTQNALDLLGTFYVGGAPDAVLQHLPVVVKSRKGFTGCLATLIVDGKLIDLLKGPEDQGNQAPYVFKGCFNDTSKFCLLQPCHNGGLCINDVDTFRCDCKLTSFVGHYCNEEAEGYQFGLSGTGGVVVFNMTLLQSVVNDAALALGFMTWSDNGTLLILRSSRSSSYFLEVRLVNGFVSIRYEFGSGVQELVERGSRFNDGVYHRLSFQRIGTSYQLQVDDRPSQLYTLQGSSSEFFRSLILVELGARGRDARGTAINPFWGIISGASVNEYQITDLGIVEEDSRVNLFGDTVIASHPFAVVGKRPDDVSPTEIVIIDGGDGDGGDGVLIPGAEGGDASAQVGNAGYSRVEEGGRAAAISGAMLALLAVVSSMMWAMYRCKPGIVGRSKVELDSSAGAAKSMLHTARKSLSDAGAGDASMSLINPGYESYNFVSSNAAARNPSRVSLTSHEIALLASSSSQPSTKMLMESRSVESGGFMESTTFSQDASQITVGRNISTQIIVESSGAGSSGRTGLGEEMSQITTSSQKASKQVVGSVGQSTLAQDRLQGMTSGQMASTQMVVELNAGRNFGGSGLSQDRSQVTGDQSLYTELVFESSGGAGNIGRTGIGQDMSQATTSTRKVSTQMIVETNIGGGDVGRAGLGQEMLQAAMDRNVSSLMGHELSGAGIHGRTGLGQETSQVTTSSRKVSTQMIVDTSTGGNILGTGLGQELSQVTSSSRKVSTQMIVDTSAGGLGQEMSQATVDRNISSQMGHELSGAGILGRTGHGQDTSQLTTSSRKVSTQMIVDTNTGGNILGTGLGQELSQVTTSSRKVSTQMNFDANTGGLGQEMSQVTTSSRKGSKQMIFEANTGGKIGGIGQETSQAVLSGYNAASVQMVDASKASVSQVPSVTITVTGHGAAMANGMEAMSADRKEELLHLSGKKRLDGKSLSPTEPHGTKVVQTEHSNSSIQGGAVRVSETRVQHHGGGFPAETSGTEHLFSSLSSDRKVSLVKGQPPQTLKLESSVRDVGAQFSIEGKGLSSPEWSDLKANASLDRSVPSIRGQPPKTLKLGSPVQHGGKDFLVSGTGDLHVTRALERSSSTVEGQPPKTLKIESPVNVSGGVTSPTVWSTTGSPFSPRVQSSSTFTETKRLGGGTVHMETFTSVQGVQANPQLPSLSLTSRKYQIRTMPVNVSEQELHKYLNPAGGVPHWQLQSALGGPSEATRVAAGHPPVGAETDRIECILLTANGQYLITGSIYGPPQVYDMKTGECLKRMEGGNLSSTDLHLASNDTLLIGQVAEVQPRFNPDIGPDGQNYKTLQVWDFDSGRRLKMENNELYTASFLMSDGEHVILSRRETNAGGASSIVIVVWDILGNQPERRISYSLENVPTDHVTYVSQTPDKRFIVAGFKSPSSGNATYLAFDLTVSNFDVVPPTVIELAAEVQVTTVLENHEAVTGTKAGALLVWSLRTGKQHRQLVAPSTEVTGGRAHQAEVRDLVVSKDGVYLISASADSTLRLWNLESSKHVRTFTGHTDMVSCCAVSNDNELVVSGSRDQTIRLWRLENGVLVTSIFTSADVIHVLLSNDKNTIAALVDQSGARKMVMLQVVRTKIRRGTGSHGESPESPDSPFTPETG